MGLPDSGLHAERRTGSAAGGDQVGHRRRACSGWPSRPGCGCNWRTFRQRRCATRFATITATWRTARCLLDIGAKTSNLLFFEKGKVYSRSINLGANSITQDFANESKLPFAEAEQKKIAKGL